MDCKYDQECMVLFDRFSLDMLTTGKIHKFGSAATVCHDTKHVTGIVSYK